jgi:hypothetical protein
VPSPGGLVVKEGLKRFVPDVGRDADAVVPHRIFTASSASREGRPGPSVPAVTRPPHGHIEPVAEDVQEHPRNVLWVYLDRCGTGTGCS